MSSGVCIINGNGIALAADSAGTYYGNKMFYNSTNKVFSLSDKYTCGAIIYNNLRMYNLSIEQMLMEFRRFLDSEACLNDFFDILPVFRKFIEKKYVYYKFDKAEKAKCVELIQSIVNIWGGKIKAVINLDDAETQIDTVLKELNDYINAGMAIIAPMPFLRNESFQCFTKAHPEIDVLTYFTHYPTDPYSHNEVIYQKAIEYLTQKEGML